MPKNKIRVQVGGGRYIDIKVVANQKVVTVKKIHPKSYILDVHSNRRAMKALTAAGYELYMYFIINVPGYTEALSLKNVTNKTSLTEKPYYRAVNELIEKEYLVREHHADFAEYYVLYEDRKPADV